MESDNTESAPLKTQTMARVVRYYQLSPGMPKRETLPMAFQYIHKVGTAPKLIKSSKAFEKIYTLCKAASRGRLARALKKTFYNLNNQTFFQKVALATVLVTASVLTLSACQQSPSDGRTTLTLSTWGSAQEMAVLKQLVQQFEKEQPGIRVKLLHIPDNYYQKLHILIAGDMTPDVMLTNSINFPIYASHHVFLNISSYIDHAAFYQPALNAFHGSYSLDAPYLYEIYAIPRDISNLVVYYNRSLFEKKKLPIPSENWTWGEFVETAKKLTEDTDGDQKPDRFGVSFYTKPPLFWLPFVWSAGGDIFNKDLSAVAIHQPKAIQGLQFVQDMRWKYHIAPRQIESGGMNMSQLFLQEKLGMLVSGRWSVPVFREQAKFDWDVVPLPVGPSGRSRVGIDASGYAVAKKSKHVKEAVLLAKFLTSKPAIEAVSESGLIVPARRDVAESNLFLNPTQKPMHGRYFLSVIKDGVPTHTPPRWNELSESLMLELQPVWDGQKKPDEALNSEVVERLNHMLQVGTD